MSYSNARANKHPQPRAGAAWQEPMLEGLEPRLLLAGDITVTIDALTTADTTPELTGTVSENLADIVVRVGGDNYSATNNGDGTWVLDDDTIDPALAYGTYDVEVLAVVGTSFGTDDTTDELLISSDAPIVTVNELTTNQLRPGLTGTVDDPNATIVLTVDGVDYPAANNGNGTWSLQANVLPVLADGTYDVIASADDGEGNIGTDETEDELIIDRVDPVVTIDAQTAHVASPELTGTLTDTDEETTVSINVNGRNYSAENNGDGTWTLDAGRISDLTDGIYDVTVTATDTAGNVGTDDTEDELEIALPPVITIDTKFTSDRTPGLTGTVSDSQAVITINIEGIDYPADNDGDGTWTLADDSILPADELADGVYDVLATAAADGLEGTDTSANELTIDNVPPTVTIDALTTTDHKPELTGTVDEGNADVVITVDGADYDAVNNGDGTWTLPDNTTVLLEAGTYDVLVTATDPAENEGTDATADELVIEPVVTIDTLATFDTTPELTGTIDDDTATIVVTVDGGDYDAVNNGDGTWVLPDGNIPPGSAIAEGTYDVQVAATANGVTGNDDTFFELVIDTSDPVVTVNDLETTLVSPALDGNVNEQDATVIVTLDGEDYEATNNGDGTWTLASGTVPDLDEDVYVVTVTATDPAGNEGEDTGSLEINISPVVTVDTLFTNQASPELTGTVDDPDADVFVDIADLTLTGAPYQADVDEEGVWTLALNTIVPALDDGTYDVQVTAIDDNLNEGEDTTTNELTVDSTAPVVTIEELTTDHTSTGFEGEVDDPAATVTVTVEGADYDATNNGDGTWTLPDFVILPLSSGTHTINVMATDAAGNEGFASTDVEITADPPAVTVDVLTTTNRLPQLTGQVSDPEATVLVRVEGQIYEATNNGDGTWTLEEGSISSALATGTYDVAVNAEDAIGNIGTDLTLNELTIISELIVYLDAGMRGVTYRDADGTVVSIRLKHYRGSGSVRLSFGSDSVLSSDRKGIWPTVVSAEAGATLTDMLISGLPAKIMIVTKGGTIPGTTVGGIGGSAEVRQFMASGVDLIDNGLDMTGYIRSLRLRSIQADVLMTGVCEQPIQIRVSEQVEDSNIRITNCNVSSFQAGSMIDSSLYVGVLGAPDENADGVFDLPEVVNLLPDFRINKFTISGYRGAVGDLFVNSNISADYVGTVKLMNARLDNRDFLNEEDEEMTDLGEFGFAANTLRRLSLRQDRVNYTYPTNWLAAPDDLTIRLV